MSSESRLLRPFRIDKRLEGALRNTEFSYGDRRCKAGEHVLIEDRTFGMRLPILQWSSEEHFEDFKRDLALGAVEMGIHESHLCLAVTARSGYLKLCERVYYHPLDDLDRLDRKVRLGEAPDGSRRQVFCAESHGAVVDAYIALRRPINVAPLRPSRTAAWFAHASFRVECESEPDLFRPQPLDDDSRQKLGLAQETVRFLELDASNLTLPLAEGDVPTFWVDEQLLTGLDRQGGSAVAQHFQRHLALDFVVGVILEFARNADEDEVASYEDIRDSLIGRVARLLAGTRADDSQRDSRLRLCRTNPGRAVALAEHAVGLRSAALKSLEQ